jgi:hypothetical protein
MSLIERVIAAGAIFVAANFAMSYINPSAGGVGGGVIFPFATDAPTRWLFGSLDNGPLALLIPTMIGLACVAVLAFFLAFLATLGLWVPSQIWRQLVLVGVACLAILLILHPTIYIALPLAVCAGLAWVAWASIWTPTTA